MNDFCPDCSTIIPVGKTSCPCGWKQKVSPRKRTKLCPKCGYTIELSHIDHGCGWMTWREQLIRDAMRTSPIEALERLWKAEKLKNKKKA